MQIVIGVGKTTERALHRLLDRARWLGRLRPKARALAAPPPAPPAPEAVTEPKSTMWTALQAGPDLRLDEHRVCDPVSWDGWLSAVMTRRLHEPLRRAERTDAGPELRILIAERDDAPPGARDQTLAAVEAMRPMTGRAIRPAAAALTDGGHAPAALLGALEGVADDALVCVVRDGDRVRPELPKALARYGLDGVDLALVDLYSENGGRVRPLLMPGFNALMAMNCDFFFSRFIAKAGLLRVELEALQTQGVAAVTPWALAAPLFARCWRGEGLHGAHVPVPLIHIAEDDDAPRAAMRRRAAEGPALWLGTPPAAPPAEPDVSVIICTRDKGQLLRQLVQNMLATQAHRVREVIIVSNDTRNAVALRTLRELDADPRVRLIAWPGAFNFSRQSNLGAELAQGELLLFLNDDIAPVSPDWVDQLAAPLQVPDVAAVGSLLIYPDERVQHAGMFLGFRGVAGHTLRFARLPDEDYGFLCQSPREVECLTGAALMMRRADAAALKGFNPLHALTIQDVDLCLRLRAGGRKLVFNPNATLIHMESVSVKQTLDDPRIGARRGAEHAHFVKNWGARVRRDAFHNPNFHIESEDLRVLAAPV